MASPEKMVVISMFAIFLMALVQANVDSDVTGLFDEWGAYVDEYNEKNNELANQEGIVARIASTVTVNLNEFWDGVKISGHFLSFLTEIFILPIHETDGMTAGELIIIQALYYLKMGFYLLAGLNVYLILVNRKT